MPDLRAECLAMAERLEHAVTSDGKGGIVTISGPPVAAATALLRRVAGALPQEPQGDVVEAAGWQPIESAPKDGTPILAYIPGIPDGFGGPPIAVDPIIYVISWRENNGNPGAWVEADGEEYAQYLPTHWRLLPPPPAIRQPDPAGQQGDGR